MNQMTKRPPHPRALPEQSEWTFELIEQAHEEIRRVAQNFGLDTYPNQLEIITAEQMMDAYTSVGMPVSYAHWSFGKHFLATEKGYKRGQMGLAYEIVINSNPCIAYLMEENSLTMQALVIAHAAYGHNSFFKGNYLFKTWTDADAIIDYMVFAKNYITECEQRHGIDAIELLLDSCHAIQNYGVDRYKRPAKLSLAQEQMKQKEREAYLQSQINELWRTVPRREEEAVDKPAPRFPPEPEENLLYLAARDRAYRAQDQPVLLPAAPDPGDERRLGHLLALHHPQPVVRRGRGQRWLHDGIPEEPHQCGVPAAGA
jgi:spore cortex formation protein SpoVR/YcgB (stage V sporulation)